MSLPLLLPSCIEKGESHDAYKKRVQELVLLTENNAHETVLRTVSALLEVFVCENFTGHLSATDENDADITNVVALGKESEEKAIHRQCIDALTADGEVLNHNVRYPVLLMILNVLVEADIQDSTPAVALWRTRVYMTHQRCLANRSHHLLERSVACYDFLFALTTLEDASSELIDSRVEGGALKLPCRAELHLAKGLMHYYYHEPHLSHLDLVAAQKLSKMRFKVTSMMGVRTEHQVFETAQLMVRASSAFSGTADKFVPEFSPQLVEGSNVLNRPRKLAENIAAGTVKEEKCEKAEEQTEDVEVEDTELTPLEQAIVLGLCVNVRNNNPMHGLTEEERLPYLERLIVEEENTPWAVRSSVYLLRSRMEQKRVRVRERGLMQFCQLCDQFAVPTTDADTKVIQETSTRHRFAQFWTVLFPSIFKLKEELANVYLDIGMAKSALDIHETIGNWERIIQCCKKLEKSTKAESLIRERLEIDPENAILWSHLGEATRNPEYFLKSWEMSEHRLAAPMRGLGELYLEKEKFAEACEAFDNALKLNPVFGANWFSMGWAAIKTQQWDRASMCYTRNVQMDNEDGHSWSNLATCYLQMGDAKLVQAYHCLIQAKKWSAKSWRIWDNLFTVAVELGERLTAAQVLSELVEYKGRDYKINGNILLNFVHGVIAVLRGEEEVNRKEYFVARKADYVDPNAPPPAEGVEELDDEIFDVVPFGYGMEFDEDKGEGENEVQAKRKQEEAEAAERGLAHAVSSLRTKVHQLLGKIVSVHTSDAVLYQAFADFQEEVDSPLEAFDLRFKDLRCLMKRNWQVERTPAMAVIASALRLVKAADKVDEETLAARTVKTTPPKTQAVMQVQPVLKLAEDSYGATPEYIALKEAAAGLQ